MSRPGARSYVYRSVDRSLLTPWFRRVWVPWFDWWIPERLPANFITLGSSVCMWLALWVAIRAAALGPAAAALALCALTNLYLVYDQVDGMHAQRTRTGTPLGEYLDHMLDAYHVAICAVVFFGLVGFDHPRLILTLLWCALLAFAATVVEQRETGELVHGAIGSLEGILLFDAIFVLWTVPPVRSWWCAPLVGGRPAWWLLVLPGALGALAATARCVRRMGRAPASFAVFAGASLALALGLGREAWPPGMAAAVLTLYGADYAGRVIGSHVLRRPLPWPDLLLPAAAAGLGWASARPAAWAGWLLAYAALRTAWGVTQVCWPLRGQWRWINLTPLNPPPVS